MRLIIVFPGMSIIIMRCVSPSARPAYAAQPRRAGKAVRPCFKFIFTILANFPMFRIVKMPIIRRRVPFLGFYALLAALQTFSPNTESHVLFPIDFLAAARADVPMLRFVEFPVLPNLNRIVNSSSHFCLATAEACSCLARNHMLFSPDFPAAIPANLPTLRLVILKLISIVPSMFHFPRALTAAFHAQPRYAGNAVLPCSVCLSAIFADMPMHFQFFSSQL